MQLQKRQRGLGLWGWIFVLTFIGFVAIITMKLIPLYLSEMAIERVVKQTAEDSGNASLPVSELRRAMLTRWDVEGITTLSVNDVKIEKFGGGRALVYDYEARAELFADISIVVHFAKKFPMAGGGGVD